MDNMQLLINLAPTIATLALGILSGVFGHYVLVKGKLHQFRHFIDSIDTAVTDDRVSEEEFREVYDAARAFIKK